MSKVASGTFTVTSLDEPIRLDLDNENDSMLYDGSGNLVSGAVTSRATLYVGSTPLTSGNDVTFVINNYVGCVAAISGNVVTVSSMTADTGYVEVWGVYGNMYYAARLTLKRIVSADKFDIIVNPNAVAYNTTTDTPSYDTITVQVYKTTITGARSLLSALPSGFTLKYYAGSSSSGTNISYSNGSGSFYVYPAYYDQYRVELANSSGVLDSETVPMAKSTNGARGRDGADGARGSDGADGMTTQYAYYRSSSGPAPSKPADNLTVAELEVLGWKVGDRWGVSYTYPYEYEISRQLTAGGSVYSGWSNPVCCGHWGRDGADASASRIPPRVTMWASGVSYYQGDTGEDYFDIVKYGSTYYICIQSHTSSSYLLPSASSAYWKALTNFSLLSAEVFFSEIGIINLLYSQQISIRDADDNVCIAMGSDGIIQYVRDGYGNVTGYMKFGGGSIGWYDPDGTAIWEIGASGVANFFVSINKWVKRNLHRLSAYKVYAQSYAAVTSAYYDGTDYYELAVKGATEANGNVGYTTSTTKQNGDAVNTSTDTLIANGYYCYDIPARQTVVPSGSSPQYVRTVFHYRDGYIVDQFDVTWSA